MSGHEMFTGITTDVGDVLDVRQQAEGLRRLRIACSYERNSIAIGASIACSGVCLTVIETGEQSGRTWFATDAAAETLRLTTAGRWQQGTQVNLERSLKVGDELGGHIVAGHADGIAELMARQDLPDMARLTFKAPAALMRFVAPKGSVALDGVSLTLNEVGSDAFSVLIIPHTLKATTFGAAKVGDPMNIEIDLMARYAARLLEIR
jgi:riboflavin synthase